jgi:hypothetical protein
MRLRPVTEDDGTFLVWESRFRPPADAADRLTRMVAEGIYEAGFDALKTIPLGLFRVVRRGFDALITPDTEARSPLERFVDAVLDGLADAPDELVDTLVHAFDEALASDGGIP